MEFNPSWHKFLPHLDAIIGETNAIIRGTAFIICGNDNSKFFLLSKRVGEIFASIWKTFCIGTVAGGCGCVCAGRVCTDHACGPALCFL